MKTFNKSFLPENILYKGEIYTLDLHSTITYNSGSNYMVSGKFHVLVCVISNHLKGKTDIHNKPYKPTQWIFTNSRA